MLGGAYVRFECSGCGGTCHRVAFQVFEMLWHLARDTKPDGTARVSHGSIAERGGISRRQAIRGVQSLIDRGVVEVVKRGGRGIGASTYCCIPGGIEIFRQERQDGATGVG